MSEVALDGALAAALREGGAPVLGIATLVRRRADGLGAAEALAACAGRHGAPAMALLAGPDRFAAVRVMDDGRLVGEAGEEVDPDGGWYEIRAFGSDLELRWRRPIGRPPIAIAVAATDEPAVTWAMLGESVRVVVLERRQLLWGAAGEPASDGWLTLVESRIGGVSVPAAAAGAGDRVQLVSHEYVTIGADGNAAILDERLVGLVPARRDEDDRR